MNIKLVSNCIMILTLLIVNMTSCKFKDNEVQSTLAQKEHTKEIITDGLDTLVQTLMKNHKIPGVSIAFINDRKLSESRNYGITDESSMNPINSETLFSVGSISKVVNAIVTLKLVELGDLNLDKNINNYLKDWKVDKNQFNSQNEVTLRHILSHTAGFSVHGFEDYYPGEPLPTTLQILNGDKPAKNNKVELILPVGHQYKYSGGGITIIQKIIEDVTGMSYPNAVSKILFEPMGLNRSIFKNPVPDTFQNIAKAHNELGEPVALPRGYQAMPEMAASGLWISTNDISTLLLNLMQTNKSSSSNYLSYNLINEMINQHENSKHGLGPYIAFHEQHTKVMHYGSNESYKAIFTLFWEEGKGYIVFTNGSNGTKFIDELKPVFRQYLGIDEK